MKVSLKFYGKLLWKRIRLGIYYLESKTDISRNRDIFRILLIIYNLVLYSNKEAAIRGVL